MESKYIEFVEKGAVSVKTEILDTGRLEPMEVVIENEASIISAGTELAKLNGMEKECSFPFRLGYGSIQKKAEPLMPVELLAKHLDIIFRMLEAAERWVRKANGLMEHHRQTR